ncbi:MAG: InlB B-repeat-containing protein [Treponema sp.]|jgi:uncharacterized repeat protein (TIGR02543 family)|nr:InlB B-repeat-containing protein [Treponema sp.]
MKTKKNAAVMKIRTLLSAALALVVLPVLFYTGCPNALDETPENRSAAPAADQEALTVVKTTAVQKSVGFTLTSTHDGEWKVYGVETGGEALSGVSVSFSAPTLTLTAAGDDLAAGDYWVSVTETDKTESQRLGLVVVQPGQSGVPAAVNADAAKTAPSQKSVSFTLTSTHDGVWKVYGVETGGAVLSGVSVSFSAPTLTLTAAGDDLAAGDYWVSVTEAGKTESPRLALTVGPYVPGQSGVPAAVNADAAKTAPSQKSVSFTLTSTHNGVWKVYGGETEEAVLSGVSVSFSAPALTLTAAGDDLAAGDYWVSVTEADKTESPRLKLSVAEYLPTVLTLGVEDESITAKTDSGVTYTVTPSAGASVAEVNGYKVINFAAAADNIDLIQTPARKYLPKDAWTMEMYVKIAAGGGNNADFLQFWTTRGESPTFRVELPNWLFIIHGLDGTKRIGASLYEDGWRHIAIVKSGNDLTLFVNGIQTATSDGYANFNTSAFSEVSTSSIGASRVAGTQLYKYLVHNRALGASDFSGVQAVVNDLNRITVTFNANGGAFNEAGNPATKTVDIFRPANTVTPPTAPELEGKTFAGWFSNQEGTGDVFTAATAVAGHTTVYAKWSDTAVTYDVTFDAYFGAFADAATSKTVTVTFPAPVGAAMPGNPALKGFTFSGWYTKKSDEDWGDEFTKSSAVAADMTVYAKWVWDDSLNITSVTYAVNTAGTALEGTLSNGSTYNETFAPALSTGSGTIEAVNGLNVSSGNRYDFGPQAGAFFSKTDWTMEVYVRSSSVVSTASPNPLLFSKVNTTKTNGVIWIENYNWYFIMREASTSVRTQTPANTAANTWHHIAYVRSGNTITVYLNGTALALGSNPNFAPLTNNARFKSLFHNYFGAGYLKFYKFAIHSSAWASDGVEFTNAAAIVNTLNGVTGD